MCVCVCACVRVCACGNISLELMGISHIHSRNLVTRI